MHGDINLCYHIDTTNNNDQTASAFTSRRLFAFAAFNWEHDKAKWELIAGVDGITLQIDRLIVRSATYKFCIGNKCTALFSFDLIGNSPQFSLERLRYFF